MKLSESAKLSYQSFASVTLALGLFGFVFPQSKKPTDGRHHVTLITTAEAQNDDESWYTPPRSPGFNELNH